MTDDRKQRLVELGAEALADALLELADQCEQAEMLVQRMTSPPAENLARFTARLRSLTSSGRYISWRGAAEFARQLEGLLRDLQAAVDDPRTGCELVAAFYRADRRILGHCDDSSGHIGGVFRFEARDLFVSYARRCADKDWLVRLVLELNQADDYGVRDALIDCAAEYLPEESVRKLIAAFEHAAEEAADEYVRRHWLYRIESLARQIGDAGLFEAVRLAAWGVPPSPAACLDIAQVHLECGDAETALRWLNKVPEDSAFRNDKRDELLFEAYGRLGQEDEQKRVARRIFRAYRSERTLERLLSLLGSEQREAVIREETALILADEALSLTDAAFLVDVGRIDEAARYLLDRSGKLDGSQYDRMLPLARAMEDGGRLLAASVLYRALLDAILDRGYSKAYHHAARYLRTLDRLAEGISDWERLDGHEAYMRQIRQRHGRKSSFWARYEAASP